MQARERIVEILAAKGPRVSFNVICERNKTLTEVPLSFQREPRIVHMHIAPRGHIRWVRTDRTREVAFGVKVPTAECEEHVEHKRRVM